MPRVDRLSADRFFARLDAFSCECPNCGEVLIVRFKTGGKRGSIVRAHAQHITKGRRDLYDPYRSRLQCSRCGRTWAVGLLLYPVGDRRHSGQPADQKPTVPQLLKMREQLRGFFVDKIQAGEMPVNIAVTADCLCPQGGWAPACPVHGSESTPEPAHGKACKFCRGKGHLYDLPEVACQDCGGTGRQA